MEEDQGVERRQLMQRYTEYKYHGDVRAVETRCIGMRTEQRGAQSALLLSR